MSPAFGRLLLLVTAAVAVAAGVVAFTVPLAPMILAPPAHLRGFAVKPAVSREKLDSLVGLIERRAPFRARRRPASVRFDPRPPVQQSDAPSSVKPVLTLSGVVWGAEPAAVVQGFPGVEGSKVVRRGDVLSGIRVTRIERDRVSLSGLDTAWSLKLKEPWK